MIDNHKNPSLKNIGLLGTGAGALLFLALSGMQPGTAGAQTRTAVECQARLQAAVQASKDDALIGDIDPNSNVARRYLNFCESHKDSIERRSPNPHADLALASGDAIIGAVNIPLRAGEKPIDILVSNIMTGIGPIGSAFEYLRLKREDVLATLQNWGAEHCPSLGIEEVRSRTNILIPQAAVEELLAQAYPLTGRVLSVAAPPAAPAAPTHPLTPAETYCNQLVGDAIARSNGKLYAHTPSVGNLGDFCNANYDELSRREPNTKADDAIASGRAPLVDLSIGLSPGKTPLDTLVEMISGKTGALGSVFAGTTFTREAEIRTIVSDWGARVTTLGRKYRHFNYSLAQPGDSIFTNFVIDKAVLQALVLNAYPLKQESVAAAAPAPVKPVAPLAVSDDRKTRFEEVLTPAQPLTPSRLPPAGEYAGFSVYEKPQCSDGKPNPGSSVISGNIGGVNGSAVMFDSSNPNCYDANGNYAPWHSNESVPADFCLSDNLRTELPRVLKYYEALRGAKSVDAVKQERQRALAELSRLEQVCKRVIEYDKAAGGIIPKDHGYDDLTLRRFEIEKESIQDAAKGRIEDIQREKKEIRAEQERKEGTRLRLHSTLLAGGARVGLDGSNNTGEYGGNLVANFGNNWETLALKVLALGDRNVVEISELNADYAHAGGMLRLALPSGVLEAGFVGLPRGRMSSSSSDVSDSRSITNYQGTQFGHDHQMALSIAGFPGDWILGIAAGLELSEVLTQAGLDGYERGMSRTTTTLPDGTQRVVETPFDIRYQGLDGEAYLRLSDLVIVPTLGGMIGDETKLLAQAALMYAAQRVIQQGAGGVIQTTTGPTVTSLDGKLVYVGEASTTTDSHRFRLDDSSHFSALGLAGFQGDYSTWFFRAMAGINYGDATARLDDFGAWTGIPFWAAFGGALDSGSAGLQVVSNGATLEAVGGVFTGVGITDLSKYFDSLAGQRLFSTLPLSIQKSLTEDLLMSMLFRTEPVTYMLRYSTTGGDSHEADATLALMYQDNGFGVGGAGTFTMRKRDSNTDPDYGGKARLLFRLGPANVQAGYERAREEYSGRPDDRILGSLFWNFQ